MTALWHCGGSAPFASPVRPSALKARTHDRGERRHAFFGRTQRDRLLAPGGRGRDDERAGRRPCRYERVRYTAVRGRRRD